MTREGRQQAAQLSRARERAAELPADAVWRSLDELSRTPRFRESVEREFPSSVMDFQRNPWSRRNFLRLMGASMALAGVYGCSERPSEKILPYVNPPEQVVPGMPLVGWAIMEGGTMVYCVPAASCVVWPVTVMASRCR